MYTCAYTHRHTEYVCLYMKMYRNEKIKSSDDVAIYRIICQR